MRRKKNTKEVQEKEIRKLADFEAANLLLFEKGPLELHHIFTSDAIAIGLETLPPLLSKNRNFPAAPFEAVFGTFSAHHSFCATKLDWKFKISEPQVTKTLAHLLAKGPAEIRTLRLRAFLTALGIRNLPGNEQMREACVRAEKDRIDFEIYWPRNEVGECGGVVVEAKFQHKITPVTCPPRLPHL